MNLSELEKNRLEQAKADLKSQTILFPAIAVSLLLLIICSVYFYHVVEKWDILDSFYFVIVTMGTVGYGDLTPTNDTAKIYTIFLIIFGIATFTAFVTQLVKRQGLKRIERELSGKKTLLSRKN